MLPSPHIKIVHSERGMVLVAAVLFVVLATVLTAAFMATTTGEREVSGNVHVAKAALYSADAGVRTAQQVLANMASFKLDSLCAIQSGTGGPVITQPQNLFPAGGMPASASDPPFTASASIAFSDSDLTPQAQVYNYRYSITASGQRGVFGSRRVMSSGILRVSAARGTFADYLMFTQLHLTPSGQPIWFTSSTNFDGRVHSNGEFRFAYQPSFQDLVTSVNTQAWYFNQGNPLELAANKNGTIDVPNFYGGFTRGAASVTLPPNSFNQQNAALGEPVTGGAPSNSRINLILGTGNGNNPPPNDIYLPNSGGGVIGGLYIQGTLDQIVARADTTGKQYYVMRQGGTTKTVTVDMAHNLTLVTVGSTTTTYTGVPHGIMYVNSGSISDLRGPDRVSGVPQPALSNGTQLLIAATGDVVLQGDVVTHDYTYGNSVLGIYSSGGSVRVGSSAPNDMYLDAYVMATGSTGSFTVDGYASGSPRGTFHLRGGMVTQYYGPFGTFNQSGQQVSGYARDFRYDRRGLVPPYYPTTPIFVADAPVPRTLVWKEL